jgi:hypothetical protein
MANFEYKNIDEILESNLPIRGVRTSLDDLKLLKKTPPLVPAISKNDTVVEFHTFLPNGAYLSSLYNTDTWKIEPPVGNSSAPVISLDLHRDFNKSQNPAGTYKIVYNFFRDILGSYDSPKMFISKISSDRTEIEVTLVDRSSVQDEQLLADFVLSYLKTKEILPNVVLNFGENKVIDVINLVSDGSKVSFFVKLYEGLPADLDLYFQCWVQEQLIKPFIDTVQHIPEEIQRELPSLKGPNFEAEIDYWTNSETEYKSWNEILSSNVQTSQEILDRYISSSNLPVQLNVNYREFDNFIFYSSAEDRVDNFVYKVELVEQYNNQLLLLDTFTGSISSNKIKIKTLRDKTISGFDNFEKWLYYETTASNYYTSQTTSSITPYPKFAASGSDYDIATKEGKFKLYPSGSDEVNIWYNDLITKSINYDLKNYNALNKAIPEHLLDSGDNEQFVTFINMIGQHFDIMYLYTDHILKKNLREEHPKDGLSQDLIYEATRNLGWTLTHGTQAKDLWEYAFGVSGSGEPIWTGKTTVGKYFTKTDEERTKEVWRRIFNNLPYIYKSKGTARGVKALLAAYGIPQTLLTIREFGGPDNADLGLIPRAEWEKHTYYLNFKGSYPLPTTQQYVSVPWEKVNDINGLFKYPEALSFRWKMEPEKTYAYGLDAEQTLLQKNVGSRVDWFVTVNNNGTDPEKGSLTFYIGDGTTYKSASIIDEYIYDDVPLNLLLRRSQYSDLTSTNQTYELVLKTAKYGKIVVERSASVSVNGSTEPNINRAWVSPGTLYVGSGSNQKTDNILSGSIFELRYWSNILNTGSFNNHVLAPRSYNGNTETSSFYDLQAQFKFWQRFDVAVTTSISSSHPNQNQHKFETSSKLATFVGFTSSSFESITETYNMEVATLANNTPFAEKVRIDSGSLIGGLSKDNSAEVSAFDFYSNDSDRLMIAFSPQDVINEDIYESLGYTQLDDYIGEYSAITKNEYTNLKWLARDYWKKYSNKNDFTAYLKLISIFDFSVFDQIRQTLPARSNPILGVVIQPNILERSKVGGIGRNIEGDPNNSIPSNELSASASPFGEYNVTEGTILIGFQENDGEVDDIQGDYDLDKEELPSEYSINVTKIVPVTKSLLSEYTVKETSLPSPLYSSFNVENAGKETIINHKTYNSFGVEYTTKDGILQSIEPKKPEVDYTVKESTLQSNIPTKPEVDYAVKESLLDSYIPKIFETSYNTKESTISESIGSDTNGEYVSYTSRVDITRSSVSSDYNNIQDDIELQITASSTYNRFNVVKSGSLDSDVGYGTGWVTQSKTDRSLGVLQQIDSYKKDGFYNTYYLYYSSSIQKVFLLYTSASLTGSIIQNQENLSIGFQNHNFFGSKLTGPDINVNTPNTPDGKPVIEIFVIDSEQIFYNTANRGGNLETR